MRKLLLGIVLAVSGFASGADLYFSINDDPNKYWDYAPGWKATFGGTAGYVPTTADNLTFNSSYLNLATGRTPMAITNGVEAVCNMFQIATSKKGSGSSYADDKRVIGVHIDGGSLTTHSEDDNACAVGFNEAGYGVLKMTGGVLNSYRISVGAAGIGVLSNDGGRVCLSLPNGDAYPRLVIGRSAGSKGTLVMSGGVIATPNASENWRGEVRVGEKGEGRFDLTGGVVSNNVIVGQDGGGHGTMNATDATLTGNFSVGYSAGSTGVVTLASTFLENDPIVGRYGDGTLTLTGDFRRNAYRSIRVGRHPGSIGRLFVKSADADLSEGREGTLYAGLLGSSEVEISGSIAFGYVKMGATNTVNNTVRIVEGGTLGGKYQMSVGSSALPKDVLGNDDVIHVGGRGELRLAGGAVKFLQKDTSPNFFLGRYAGEFPGSFGVLRGWGRILPAWDGETNVRMAIGDGQVVADGMGEERTLDLHQVVNVTNLVANGVSTTNGWYAVNKGAVLFPRTWFGQVSPATRCFGAAPYASKPDFVNSVQLTMRGVAGNNNHIRGGLYAPDRSDVHADALPPHDAVVGIWKMGNFSSVDDTGKVGFSSIDLTFRYDQTRVAENRTLALYRWNDATSSWERLTGGAPAADHRISVTGLTSQTVDGHNVGLFALVTRVPGALIIFR